jgi:DNA-binding transcriptional LysR family regulator
VQEFVRNHPLEIRQPPYDSARVRTTMQWHRRPDRHPAHRWLREIMVSLAKSLQ